LWVLIGLVASSCKGVILRISYYLFALIARRTRNRQFSFDNGPARYFSTSRRLSVTAGALSWGVFGVVREGIGELGYGCPQCLMISGYRRRGSCPRQVSFREFSFLIVTGQPEGIGGVTGSYYMEGIARSSWRLRLSINIRDFF